MAGAASVQIGAYRRAIRYLKVIGWGWFYLSTVLDDYSRFILAWRLCTGMAASYVSATLEQALAVARLDQATVVHRPRLLSDNGPSYVSAELATWLKARAMAHTRGKPYHPMTQGKIERWHRSMKNEPDEPLTLLNPSPFCPEGSDDVHSIASFRVAAYASPKTSIAPSFRPSHPRKTRNRQVQMSGTAAMAGLFFAGCGTTGITSRPAGPGTSCSRAP